MPETPIDRQNRHALYKYNLFNSFALSIAANVLFTDILLLKLDFDPSRLAYAKSAMFIAPALCYQLLAPHLQSLNRDREICIWSYALRISVPMLLPIVAIFHPGPTVLFWTSVFVMGAGFTLAAFANNTLAVLYRKVLPPEHFNQYSGLINLLFNAPAICLSLLAAVAIDQMKSLQVRQYCLILTGMELAMFIFETPAIVFLKRLHVPSQPKAERPSWRDYLAPLADPNYRRLLAFGSLRSLWRGLLLSLASVFFLEIVGFSALSLSVAFSASALVGTCLCTWLSPLIDRRGYRPWLMTTLGATLAVTLAFCVSPMLLAMQLLFLVFVGDAGNSLGGYVIAFTEYTMGTRFASLERTNSYVATYSFVSNMATFGGCILGGVWHRFLTGHMGNDPATVFQTYFLSSCPLLVAMLLIVAMTPAWDRPPTSR